ncbi:MAG: undecaprenyl-diphosphate phosphatase [Methylophilaceae bacterium]|jgi:undecaprenyl-diphosphatase|nr:MAG: undecaprenyl-diphosphate phosphatase [Methylophilaceae bacterium]
MDLLLLVKALILGLVEGITEFLPISSTGHLIIAGDLLNFNDEKGKVFEIVIQLAAILAVCWEYRVKLVKTLLDVTGRRLDIQGNQKTQVSQSNEFVLNLLIAFLPAAVLGLAFHSAIKTYLFSPLTVAIALIVGGFAILLIEYKAENTPSANVSSIDQITKIQAIKIGFAQSLALIPGVSRAGATILGGMVFGLNRQIATEFSFFLAIPIMFAATAYDLLKNWQLLSVSDIGMFTVGFITAFASALLVIKMLLKFVATHNFKVFAWYRIAFGALVVIYYWNLT